MLIARPKLSIDRPSFPPEKIFRDIERTSDNPNDVPRIDWLASTIVGKIPALEFITFQRGRETRRRKGRIKRVRNSWSQVEVDLFGRSIFILASWHRRCGLRAAMPTRENGYTRFRRRVNDVSCSKTAREVTVSPRCRFSTDATRIWTGNSLLRQQLRTYLAGVKERQVFPRRKRDKFCPT